MTTKKKANNKLQSVRFIEAAKKAESDQTGKTFERAFKKIVKADKPQKAK